MTSFSQNKKNEEPPLTLSTNPESKFIFDTVIEINETSKKEIFKRAKDWVMSNVRTYDNNIEFDDENNDHINTTVNISLDKYHNASFCNFKLTFHFKENKCRITGQSFKFKSVFRESEFENTKFAVSKTKVYKEFDEKFQAFINQAYKAILATKDDNW